MSITIKRKVERCYIGIQKESLFDPQRTRPRILLGLILYS